MDKEMQARIDAMDYEQLLRKNRFAPLGDPMMMGEVGDYFCKRLGEMRDKHPNPSQVSKDIGWG